MPKNTTTILDIEWVDLTPELITEISQTTPTYIDTSISCENIYIVNDEWSEELRNLIGEEHYYFRVINIIQEDLIKFDEKIFLISDYSDDMFTMRAFSDDEIIKKFIEVKSIVGVKDISIKEHYEYRKSITITHTENDEEVIMEFYISLVD